MGRGFGVRIVLQPVGGSSRSSLSCQAGSTNYNGHHFGKCSDGGSISFVVDVFPDSGDERIRGDILQCEGRRQLHSRWKLAAMCHLHRSWHLHVSQSVCLSLSVCLHFINSCLLKFYTLKGGRSSQESIDFAATSIDGARLRYVGVIRLIFHVLQLNLLIRFTSTQRNLLSRVG